MATIERQGTVLVRLRDEDGREGLGEASVIPHYGAETVEAVKLVIDGYLPPRSLGRTRRVWRRCWRWWTR